MVRNYKKKEPKYAREVLDKAITEVTVDKLSIRVVASKYNISKSVLARLVLDRSVKKRGRKTAFTPDQEKQLVKYISILSKWGFALSRKDVLEVVKDFVESNDIKTPFKHHKPGSDWFRDFCKRNGLKLKNLEALEQARRKNTSDPFLIYGFYDLVESNINELKIKDKPANIWNLDETGFALDPKGVKGVALEKQKVHRTIMGSGKENISVMACCSAAGAMLPPMVIYKGEKLWTTWRGENDLPGTLYAVSKKGYINSDIFNDYFEHFCTKVKERPLLLIFDGHTSHLEPQTIERAIKEKVTIIKLPSHTTDLLQPLDKCVFRPLKSAWNQKLIEWQRMNQRKMTKPEFVDTLCAIWNEALSAENIKKGFESTGIYPINREKYPKERLDVLKLDRYTRTKQSDETNVNQGSNTNTTDNNQQTNVPTELANSDSNIEPQPSTSSQPEVQHTSQSGPSTPNRSFEELLLDKIGKSTSVVKPRKQVTPSAQVITTECFLEAIQKAKEGKKVKTAIKIKKEPKDKPTLKKKLFKKPSGKQKKSTTESKIKPKRQKKKAIESSDSEESEEWKSSGSDDELILSRPTTSEEDTEMCIDPLPPSSSAKSAQENESNNIIVKAADFILVKFHNYSKKSQTDYRYVAVVQETYEDNESTIMCLKSIENSKTLFKPDEEDISLISNKDIAKKLESPKVLRTGDRLKYEFSSPLDINEKK